MTQCRYCDKPADTVHTVGNTPICVECLFDNEEFGKFFNENDNHMIGGPVPGDGNGGSYEIGTAQNRLTEVQYEIINKRSS